MACQYPVTIYCQLGKYIVLPITAAFLVFDSFDSFDYVGFYVEGTVAGGGSAGDVARL